MVNRERVLLGFGTLVIGLFFAVNLCIAQPKADWPKKVTIGAAPVGGTGFLTCTGLGKLLNEKMGVFSSVEQTGGPVHNNQLLEVKQLDFGITTAGPLWEGWQGLGFAKGKKHQNVRVVYFTYTQPFHAYALKKTGIKTIYDANGKSFGVGPKGGTPDQYFPKIFEAAGIKPSRILNANSADLDSQLKDGMVDVNGSAPGMPWGLINQIETTHEINLLEIPKTVGEKVHKNYPFLTLFVIPAGMYKTNKNHGLETVTIGTYISAHKDIPDDFVYEVVKTVFHNTDLLASVHPSARENKPQAVVDSPIPIHRGAAKYYKEIGIALPSNLVID
jgi:uncharacterized protein